MKNLASAATLFLSFTALFGQNSEVQLLKKYDLYVEKNLEMGKWSTKYYLLNGRISTEETYWKNELRRRTNFIYDEYDNVKQEIETYNINDGKVNNVSQIKLEYNDNRLILKEFDYGITIKYSDFNELGKPRLIERIVEESLQVLSYKEMLEYDNKGNVLKSMKFNAWEDKNGKTTTVKGTTRYKYDIFNNVIEVHREFEPEQQFPIPITGGPSLYRHEHFRYKYNKYGLWTKKHKTLDGKEFLVAKRKYK